MGNIKESVHSLNGSKGAAKRWGYKAIASGQLNIGNVCIDCYVLNSRDRVLSTQSFIKAMNMTGGGYKTGEKRLVRFVNGQAIRKFASDELVEKIANPLEVKTTTNRRSLTYHASVLPDLCFAVMEAAEQGVLQKQQLHIAARARVLAKGFSTVGVISLIDEATGYQYIRERDALANILETFIAKEAAVWVKTFPDEFYSEMFRLRGVEPEDFHKRPIYFGRITNDLVYARLAPAILDELKKKNPKDPEGRRIQCHHQWLTKNKGYRHLEIHIAKLIAYMQTSSNWADFKEVVDKYLPKHRTTLNEE